MTAIISPKQDQILKDLLETNVRQRGDIGGSVKKIGLRIKELERLYGVRDGSAGNEGIKRHINLSEGNYFPRKTQEELAKQLGMDVRTLRNYKLLAEMIPELEDLLDTGIVTKTTDANQEYQKIKTELFGLDLGDTTTKTDIMEWMINTQLGRRNLIPAQKLTVLDKFKKRMAEEAKERMAGVGTGTVARYNKVMNSDDEELKQQVLAGEVSINAGYRTVREKEVRANTYNKEETLVIYWAVEF